MKKKNYFEKTRWRKAGLYVLAIAGITAIAVALSMFVTNTINSAARAAADDFSKKLFRSVVKYNAECMPPPPPRRDGPI